ncbi:MAG: fructose-1,6-bisphosphatase [Anaerolineales bacterium]|nr:fructose-1,6-bisphosphatase [Anaerolineales bacterium]MCB8953107.1 fructose-1,6-bisphosphatase [Ardenticatenales bacterium]
MEERERHYLQLLARQYPSIQAAATEIINQTANLQLPKGTEHFLSDIHGEYEAFRHVLRSGSGSIKRKIDEHFGNELTELARRHLATLIYYPEQALSHELRGVSDAGEWYRITLFRLIRLCRVVSSKYTRGMLRAAMPAHFAATIEELLHEQEGIENKHEYYQTIIDTIIDTGQGRTFITALAYLIQRLAIARLHIIGDIYDRGPGAHNIMDTLMAYHSLDIQWGNHDIVWMGAAGGSEACIANVIRIGLRYGNMETLENGYAISMLPLASFAVDVYGHDDCALFHPQLANAAEYTENELRLMAQMHKAITIIQLKLEAHIIRRRSHYRMENRLLLDKLDLERGVVVLDGQEHPLLDSHFPTIDPQDPYALTAREEMVMERLRLSFANSERLQKHIRFLYSKGSMYLVYNGNLLYHGCIPMHHDGSFWVFRTEGQEFTVQSYMDRFDMLARQGYFADDPAQKQYGLDAMWYLWSGSHSPLFGKDKMATFERYFIADKATHKESMNPYYQFRDREETARRILAHFGLDPETGHIINGHVPVKVRKGESPIKAGGKLLVIDGGFARAYQKETGIAGYTLIFNSYGLMLASHEPFESTQKAIDEARDIHSKTSILEANTTRLRVKDTDEGRAARRHIADLRALLEAYRGGVLKG